MPAAPRNRLSPAPLGSASHPGCRTAPGLRRDRRYRVRISPPRADHKRPGRVPSGSQTTTDRRQHNAPHLLQRVRRNPGTGRSPDLWQDCRQCCGRSPRTGGSARLAGPYNLREQQAYRRLLLPRRIRLRTGRGRLQSYWGWGRLGAIKSARWSGAATSRQHGNQEGNQEDRTDRLSGFVHGERSF